MTKKRAVSEKLKTLFLVFFTGERKSEVMAEGENRRVEVGEEVGEASDSAAKEESSGSQDNIDNDRESCRRATCPLSVNKVSLSWTKSWKSWELTRGKRKEADPKGRKMRGKLEKIRSWKSFGGKRN